MLALDNDSATLFGTVIVRDLAPDVPIVARVNQAINVERIHRAGADFALSISQVSGQVLAQRLLGEEAVSLEPGLRLVKIPAGALAGQRAQDLRLREELGCSIVAVERKKELITQLEREFKFEAGDDLFVCGSGEAVRNFRRRFAPSEESRSAAATVPPAAADPPARVG